MDPVTNPFVPGAGTAPAELAGRDSLIEQLRIALVRAQAGRPARSLVAVGLRGVGKTVLLNRAQIMAEQLDHLTIYIEAQESRALPGLIAPGLRKALLTLDRAGAANAIVKRALRGLRAFVGTPTYTFPDGTALSLAGVDPEAGLADSGVLDADLPDLIVAVGKAAAERGRAVTLLIDELQYLTEADLSATIMAMHRTAQLNLPVLMVGAGLPLIVGLSGQAKSYAERLFDFPGLGPLTRDDSIRALQNPVKQENADFSPDAIEQILLATQGYPYFLQEWGYHSWNVAPSPRITKAEVALAHVRAIQRLDEGFFRVRLDRLTPAERDYLRAMAELGPGPHRSGDVARILHRSTSDLGVRRDALIRKGMIWSPAYGDVAFTVPMFDAFMHRAIPHWAAPPRPAGRKPSSP
jgi:hypothetical protein